MGKGRDKQKKRDRLNPEKQSKKHERQIRKEQKHNLRQQKKLDGDDVEVEEDINLTVERMKTQTRQLAIAQLKSGPQVIEIPIPKPTERINATLMPHPGKDATHFLLFGGEYWNGAKTWAYGELFRYGIVKSEWHHIEFDAALVPPPRSSHQAVCFARYMFVFGGEFTSVMQNQFYHYRDTWRLFCGADGADGTSTQSRYLWEEVAKANVRPQPRSGHRMCLLPKHKKIVLFGGFFDTTGDQLKYYNDLWVLENLDCGPQWSQLVEESSAPTQPAPRSGHCMAVHEDSILLYGGFALQASAASNTQNQSPHVFTDLWEYHFCTGLWRSLKKLGIPPTIRSGMTLVQRGNRCYIFGGVFDAGDQNETRWRSRFFNDLYLFNAETRRFFPLPLRKKNTAADRKTHYAKEGSAARGVGISLEEELAEVVPELNLAEENELVDVYHANETGNHRDQSTISADSSPDSPEGNVPLPRYTHCEVLPGVNVPCPRFGAMLCLVGHTLFIYGGQTEESEREITFDDMYSLNLNQMYTYEVLQQMDITKQPWYHEDQDWETLCSMATGALPRDQVGSDCASTSDERTLSEKSSQSSRTNIADQTEEDDPAPSLTFDVVPTRQEHATSALTQESLALLKNTTCVGRQRSSAACAKAKGSAAHSLEHAQERLQALLSEMQREEQDRPVPRQGERFPAFFTRTSAFWKAYMADLSEENQWQIKGSGESFARQCWNDFQPILEQVSHLQAQIYALSICQRKRH